MPKCKSAGCDFEAKSGYAVGRHRREAHPNEAPPVHDSVTRHGGQTRFDCFVCSQPPLPLQDLIQHLFDEHGVRFKGKEESGRLVATELAVPNADKTKLPPGTILGQGTGLPGKIPWTRKAVEERFPMVDFEPEENTPVIFNGVRYELFEGRVNRVPNIIKAIYDESRRETRTAHLPKQDSDRRGLGIPGRTPVVQKVGVGMLSREEGA